LNEQLPEDLQVYNQTEAILSRVRVDKQSESQNSLAHLSEQNSMIDDTSYTTTKWGGSRLDKCT
jgi:hypothetical protein